MHVDWYLRVLKKYAVFEGRASRREYWMFFLINLLISIGLGIVDGVFRGVIEGATGTDLGTTGFLGSIYGLAVLVPSLAVGVRRLHDTGRSGWWLLISLVPLLGAIVLLVFLASAGQPGPNRYGPDPKAEEAMGAGAPAAAAGTTPAAAGWMRDPSGRHELRYWDGQAWTSHVSDGGAQSDDPL